MPTLYVFWERLAQDARYGWRMLIARPGFSSVAVLSIALGIGATTAIFSVVYAVLMDPYPYRAADRIGWLGTPNAKGGGMWQLNYLPAQYLEIKSRVHSMEDEIAVVGRDAVLGGKDLLPESVRQEDCSANFFEFFGVPPLFGRVFTSKDFPHGQEPDPVTVISYKFWQHAFQGDREVIGRKILLNDKEYTIIGVLPIRFTWQDVDAYTPMNVRPGLQEYVDIYYRVRRGVSRQQITAEFNPLIQVFRKQAPRYFYPDGPVRPEWVTVSEGILRKFATTLLVLFGAVFLLLLIACGNVANLLLARAAAREGEMAIRVSIGATRLRLVRQLLTESVMLALAGGIFGVALAFLGIKGVTALMPVHAIPHEAVIAINWAVLWFAAGVSVLTGIIFGLAPALHVSAATHAQALKSTSKGSGTGGGHRRLHDLLMIFEVTLSLVLLTGAGLAVKGLIALQQQRLGYDPDHVLTFRVQIGDRYPQWASERSIYEQLLDRFSRLPGAEGVALSDSGTPPYNGFMTKLMLDDRPASEAVSGRVNMVSSAYFETLHVPLIRGRWFDHGDILRASPVALISQDFALRCFGNRSPLGRRVQVDLFNEPLPRQMLKAPTYVNSFEIVGVVGAARNRGLRDQPDPALFIPYPLLCTPFNAIFIRTRSEPMAFVKQAREAVKSVDPHAPIMFVRTLQEWVDSSTAYPRFATFLFGVFGGIGMLLAAAGVFSVVSYAVAHRTREFGLRMALGAKPGDVLRLVLASTTRMLALGLSIGLVLSIFVTRVLANRMEGMGTPDVSLFAGVPAVLIVATLVACFLPARSATLIQPMDALRQE
ncbi:MAG TPA: ABC transporter permease [Bryobacteraceae bacterium]|nr:ABC transporter permease [Bryobacteraceae bacterium]